MYFLDLTLQAKVVPRTREDSSASLVVLRAIEDRTVGAGDLLCVVRLIQLCDRFDCLFDCLVAGCTTELKR